MGFKTWFLETRPHFLILSLMLVPIGGALAYYHGFFNPLNFALALAGLILLHVSVNVLNDYFDYKYGIDFQTSRTPFSGGSGFLPSGALNPSAVYRLGITLFLCGAVIGIYFLLTVGLILLPIIILGAIFVCLYTSHLVKIWGIAEISAGLGLGALPVLGAYLVQTGFYSLEALLISVPSGMLTFNLLFLNEFPDVEADRKGGRRHLVILLGRRRAGEIYAVLALTVYAWILGCVMLELASVFLLICFATFPLAYKAVKIALKDPEKPETLMSAMKLNVLVVLATQALLAVSYVIAALT
jgi:1,4-dihydroxy-2-naphthoate octaprenyltransferase